jgi:microcystin-dependent protein
MPLDFPSNPTSGQIYDNYYWDAADQIWRSSGIVTPKIPAGIIQIYAGQTAPDGYLMCIGQEVLITQYTALYNALTASGTVFPYGANTNGSGSAGSTHFRLPDLRGDVVVGKAGSGTFQNLGAMGGAEVVTLDSTQIPSHTHTVSDPGHFHNTNHNHTIGDHSHSQFITANAGGPAIRWDYRQDGSSYTYPQGCNTAGVGTLTTSTNNPQSDTKTTGITVGGQSGTVGQSHNNLQPYIVLNYIIKV